jgi:hypothetical protein
MRSALARSSGNRVGARLHRIANGEESLKGGRKHCTAPWRDYFKIRQITHHNFKNCRIIASQTIVEVRK